MLVPVSLVRGWNDHHLNECSLAFPFQSTGHDHLESAHLLHSWCVGGMTPSLGHKVAAALPHTSTSTCAGFYCWMLLSLHLIPNWRKDCRKLLSLKNQLSGKDDCSELAGMGKVPWKKVQKAKTRDMKPWLSALTFICQPAGYVLHVIQSEDYFFWKGFQIWEKPFRETGFISLGV